MQQKVDIICLEKANLVVKTAVIQSAPNVYYKIIERNICKSVNATSRSPYATTRYATTKTRLKMLSVTNP
jgi:hypothetical protein